jgi:hypothetical protein
MPINVHGHANHTALTSLADHSLQASAPVVHAPKDGALDMRSILSAYQDKGWELQAIYRGNLSNHELDMQWTAQCAQVG